MANLRQSTSRPEKQSSAIEPLPRQLKEKGFADVMVFLKEAVRSKPASANPMVVAAGVGGAATVSFQAAGSDVPSYAPFEATLPAELMNCFESAYEESTEEGMTSLSLRAPLSTRVKPDPQRYQVSPVTFLENLGIVLGSVSTNGLNALRRQKMVRKIRPIPELRLIRPRRISLAQPRPEINWGLRQLNIPSLWKKGLDGQGIKIGHLDTGADGTHPMLRDAFAAFAEFNYIGKQIQPDPPPHDTDVHGTHTAGIIVGRPVDSYRMGVAPKAKLASGIVIEGGKVTLRILAGLNWILRQGVRVLSVSLGIPGRADFFLDITNTLLKKGILVVVAIGNEGPGTSRYPGNYANVLSVGAVDENQNVAHFSSSDQIPPRPLRIVPDLVAPGVGIVSCAPGNRYISMDGTSMATPYLAGLAALLFQSKPSATPARVRRAILESCELAKPITRDRVKYGIPDAEVALRDL